MPVDVALREVPTDPKTCLITVVENGSSDAVIKVFPAEHENEKIWLSNARDGERWEAINRLIENHAERGTRIPKPAKWHSDPKQLANPTLKSEDIPLIKLEGIALKAPPVEERIDPLKVQHDNIQDLSKKVNDLTNIVGSLAASLSQIVVASSPKTFQAPQDAAKRGRGRPRKTEVHTLGP